MVKRATRKHGREQVTHEVDFGEREKERESSSFSSFLFIYSFVRKRSNMCLDAIKTTGKTWAKRPDENPKRYRNGGGGYIFDASRGVERSWTNFARESVSPAVPGGASKVPRDVDGRQNSRTVSDNFVHLEARVNFWNLLGRWRNCGGKILSSREYLKIRRKLFFFFFFFTNHFRHPTVVRGCKVRVHFSRVKDRRLKYLSVLRTHDSKEKTKQKEEETGRSSAFSSVGCFRFLPTTACYQ